MIKLTVGDGEIILCGTNATTGILIRKEGGRRVRARDVMMDE